MKRQLSPLETEDMSDNLSFSFLTKTFSNLSKIEKEKILKILRNTENLEKVG